MDYKQHRISWEDASRIYGIFEDWCYYWALCVVTRRYFLVSLTLVTILSMFMPACWPIVLLNIAMVLILCGVEYWMDKRINQFHEYATVNTKIDVYSLVDRYEKEVVMSYMSQNDIVDPSKEEVEFYYDNVEYMTCQHPELSQKIEMVIYEAKTSNIFDNEQKDIEMQNEIHDIIQRNRASMKIK